MLLVDARHGILTQTRRHAYLVSLMGIRRVALALNKMDLVNYDAAVFERIGEAFRQFASPLGFDSITAIPLSALKGDNITRRSVRTPWYAGPTLIGYLETVPIKRNNKGKLAFPIQWVNRPDSSFRGFSGCATSGSVKVGDEIRVTASGQTARVAEIVTLDGSLVMAETGEAVTLKLDREIDASRGDVISSSDSPIEMTDQFEATLMWMHEEAGLSGRGYDIKLATQWASASITGIKYRVDVNTLAHAAATKLELNDIGVCNLATTRPLAFAAFQDAQALGSFILVDRYTHATVAAGMIRHTATRAKHAQTGPVDHAAGPRGTQPAQS